MPPMAFSTDWLALGVTYLVLALVTLGTVLWLAWLNSKIQVHRFSGWETQDDPIGWL
ncbi:MAG: hypothetical protein Ct9H300mP11_14010 [Chloroflexota bacterium]|nr:MAG: hypothetical protein Ct9H300mP11_14010 [Chloroflexota bacterium]